MSRRTGEIIVLTAALAALSPALCRMLARSPPTSAAIHRTDPSACLAAGTYGATRDAGPASMRDGDGVEWDRVDQASDESFPASDAGAVY